MLLVDVIFFGFMAAEQNFKMPGEKACPCPNLFLHMIVTRVAKNQNQNPEFSIYELKLHSKAIREYLLGIAFTSKEKQQHLNEGDYRMETFLKAALRPVFPQSHR